MARRPPLMRPPSPGLGVIHKGNLAKSRTIMGPYLPASPSAPTRSPYRHGGAALVARALPPSIAAPPAAMLGGSMLGSHLGPLYPSQRSRSLECPPSAQRGRRAVCAGPDPRQPWR